MNSHLLHDNTLIIQLKQITYIGNFTQKYLTRKSILYSFLLVFTQNYSKLVFFGNLILNSLDTHFIKTTRVRVSTSVKKEVLMIEYWSKWVLSDHTSVYNFGGSIRLKSEFGIFYSSHGRLYRDVHALAKDSKVLNLDFQFFCIDFLGKLWNDFFIMFIPIQD